VTSNPHTIDPSRTALLVMDLQPGILDRLADAEALLGRVGEAIDTVRRHGARVAYVRVAFADEDYQRVPAHSRFSALLTSAGKAMHSDSPSTAIHDRVAPEPGDIVVRKTRVGAFSTTDLHERLRERDIDTVILAGISTSGVVLSTVRDASDRDYRVFVLADGTADPDPEIHRFLTERIFPPQASVITLAELEALFLSSPESDQ
jgi:nicotinamidase-related amidase